jgi:pimeloyl-ACP methyl ester carboxylesterase
MATFVLVHGAWHGGWCWKRVAALLRQAGHEVFAPTLTGLGERAHLMSDAIDLHTHIQDILGVLQWEELADVVLCGHSYGGMVISGVADRVPEKLRSLVYLDAFVPDNGTCLMDYVSPEQVASIRDYAQTKGGGFRMAPIPAETLNVNPQDRAWVNRQCVEHPLKCFEQKLSLTGELDQGAEARVRLCAWPASESVHPILHAPAAGSGMAHRDGTVRHRGDA